MCLRTISFAPELMLPGQTPNWHAQKPIWPELYNNKRLAGRPWRISWESRIAESRFRLAGWPACLRQLRRQFRRFCLIQLQRHNEPAWKSFGPGFTFWTELIIRNLVFRLPFMVEAVAQTQMECLQVERTASVWTAPTGPPGLP